MKEKNLKLNEWLAESSISSRVAVCGGIIVLLFVGMLATNWSAPLESLIYLIKRM